MQNKRVSVRLNARQLMLLDEISDLSSLSVSVIIRGCVDRGIDAMLDEEGHFKFKKPE